MRIVISGMFWQEPHVGSGQYLRNLLSHLTELDSHHKFVLVIPRYTDPQKPRLHGVQTVVMPTPFDQRHNLAKVWFEQVALLQVARKVRADLIHVPYFGPPLRSKQPVIVSVLDLIPLLVPAYRRSRLVRTYTALASAGARRAAAVVAISEHTKADVVRHLQLPADRIAVTYLAAGPSYYPQSPAAIAEVRDRFQITGPYIYYIGGYDLRKNVELLIRAFAGVVQQCAMPPQLVLAGRPPGTDPALFSDVPRLIIDAGIAPHVAMLGPVSDAENAALMAGAVAFVFPSLYEGFGLTPLEAMCCGAPVVASATTSVGEVVAGGGVLLDPQSASDWTAILLRLVHDPAYAEELRLRARQRAAQFDWQITARQTVEVYQRMGRLERHR